jgi:hypothetical protein
MESIHSNDSNDNNSKDSNEDDDNDGSSNDSSGEDVIIDEKYEPRFCTLLVKNMRYYLFN